ncbi:hypothetical protein [Vibrio furnissii]|uniref:hypothetical protein n=1 Tax=Vibrio furnissii TaxID=29494 RepID=UPI001EEA7AF6|nr:hypothetical protein [Vibrio furnissii]MCG6231512.1 hypothetical protein [Vibrio furnissii]MCG6261437.1 hypothetical protein [Vibrio furnissii]
MIEKSESILDSTIQEVDIIENHRVEIADKLQAEEEELSLVSVQLSYAKSSLKKLEEKIAHTKEVLSDTVKIVLEQVLFDSFMLSLSKLNKGNYQAAYKKYINRVINKFNQLAGIKPLIPFLDGVKEVMKEDGIDIDNDL